MAADKATAQQADLPVIEIGTKIRFTRRLRSLTLKEVSAATGCSESLLSKIENGHASPSLKMLQRLTVCTENLNPNIVVMKSAQDGVRTYDAGSLNRTRDRRILVQ
jgi:transcriptional regulator with XRE-family HTH domain